MLCILAATAETFRTNEINSSVFISVVQIGLLVLGILVGLANLRRKPSVDVDLVTISGALKNVTEDFAELSETVDGIVKKVAEFEQRLPVAQLATLNESVSGVHKHLSAIDGRLRDGDQVIAGLRERQAVNAESIKVMRGDLHEVHSMVITVVGRMEKRGRSRSSDAD